MSKALEWVAGSVLALAYLSIGTWAVSAQLDLPSPTAAAIFIGVHLILAFAVWWDNRGKD